MDAPALRDRYELGPRLGGGRGSSTHAATRTDTGERCVVKSLSVGEVVRESSSEHSFDPDDFTKVVELFEREARVLSHLDHPGIPRFIDHFTESVGGDTRLHTVQELVEGKTLKAHVEDGRHFTEPEAKEICRQVAGILDYLHDRSPPLIHRDIKPTNVILDDDGTVHLVDFGSVRNAIGGDGLDGKTIVGTYGYMPVEQYEARAVPQSDLYALGMTLVYVLSHRGPTEIGRKGMALDFRPHVQVSDAFARTLERMIAPAPEDRQGSAKELLAELDGRATGSLGQAFAATPGHNARWVAAALALLGALGAVLLVLMPAAAPVAPADTAGGREGPPVSFQPGGEREPISPVDGVLTVDIDRGFSYVAQGFPMGRAVGQTTLPILTPSPFEDLVLPEEVQAPGVTRHFGFIPLGNGMDGQIAFVLARRAGPWMLWIDQDNDEDLTNNGPARQNEGTNGGTGPIFAAELFVQVDVLDVSSPAVINRPYHLWIWFDEVEDGQMRGRFYARNHYAGRIAVGGELYDATAFEDERHDALYRESGLCIDLDGDGECAETVELFRDGDVVPFPGEDVRLALEYP